MDILSTKKWSWKDDFFLFWLVSFYENSDLFLEFAYLALHKKWSFPLKISLVNKTKSEVWPHSLKKLLSENLILCAVWGTNSTMACHSKWLWVKELAVKKISTRISMIKDLLNFSSGFLTALDTWKPGVKFIDEFKLL